MIDMELVKNGFSVKYDISILLISFSTTDFSSENEDYYPTFSKDSSLELTKLISSTER